MNEIELIKMMPRLQKAVLREIPSEEVTGKGWALVVDCARVFFRRLWPEAEVIRDTHSCLFMTACLQGVLATIGIKTMLQAGSCQWPMLEPENDDGECATHFSYQWEGLKDDRTNFFFRAGALPEMHCWLAYRDPDTIVDATSGSWPERAHAGGHSWETPRPPDFLWHTADELESLVEREFKLGIRYEANLEACKVADELASREIYPKVAEALGFQTEGSKR